MGRTPTTNGIVLWGALLATLGGCGLESAGAEGGKLDADAIESGSDVTVLPIDAGEDVVSDVAPPPPPDAATCKSTGPCTNSVPMGWTLALSPLDATTACPAGYAAHDALAGVTAKPGACDCACTVTKDPACDVGPVTFFYSMDNSCGGAGVTPVFPGCKDITLFNITNSQKATKLAPTGGTCTAAIKENKTLVDKASRRACDVPPLCAEDVCTSQTAGWNVCITHTGDVACPGGWAKKQVTGSDFTLGCSGCPSCDVNGPSSCANASVHLYSDSNCATETASFVVDGTCGAVTGAGASVHYAKYLATLNKVCTTGGAKTANPALTGKSTICCK